MKKKIILNVNQRAKSLPKGITPEATKKIAKRNGFIIKNEPVHILAKMEIKKKMPSLKRKNRTGGVITSIAPRPLNKFLTSSLADKVTRIELPQKGSFNPGFTKMPDSDDYIMVYRPSEYSFIGCILDKNLKVKKKSYFPFSMTNCADPRLTWLPDKRLLMSYSSTSEVGLKYECIRGSIIMDLNEGTEFIDGKPFRISSSEITTRQKNWMPFINEDKLYMIASVCPHIIYEVKIGDNTASSTQKFENKWYNPWMFNEFLRGNTNVVQLDDGTYLGTFHTASWHGSTCYYDNGCYLFEGKAPFKVLKCSNRTYLSAEDAVEPHVRKKNLIKCTFPVGMVKEDNRLLISYGDNDSVVKIMETTVEDMLGLMLEVY